MAKRRGRRRETKKMIRCLRDLERKEPGSKKSGKAYAICQVSVNRRPVRKPGGRWP